MATVIRVPPLGIGIANVRVTQWLVAEGAPLAQGDPLLEVETDKMNMEVPAEVGGVLARVFAAEGEDTPEGTALAIVAEPGEDVAALVAEIEAERRDGADATGAPADAAPATASAGAASGGVKALPAARRLAAERGVDLATVAGTGPRGAITAEDVARALGEGAPGS